MFGRRKKTPVPESGRRRPLVGPTTRTQDFSYYARQRSTRGDDMPAGRNEPMPRSKREILRFVGQRFGLIIVIIATIALIISSIQVSMSPKITIVNDTAVYRIHDDEVYAQALSRSLKGSWANSNKVTINTSQLAADLKQQYPELADVSVALPVLGQRPIAYLQLTRPSVLLVTATGGAYVLDETGRVLAPASQVTNLDSLKLPTVSDQSGLTPKVGELALSGTTVRAVRGIVYQLQAAKVPYSQLTLPQAAQELDIALTGKSYYVRFNMHDTDPREQAGAFLAVQAKLNANHVTPTAYIDVRLAGKAYYK